MATQVIKRDGCKVAFDASRIEQAVRRAAQAAGVADSPLSQTITASVCERLQTQHEVDISDIQRAVEDALMASAWPQVARCWIEYRHDRDLAREQRGRLNTAIRGLIEQSDAALLSENANKDGKVIPTQRDLLAGIVAKHYATRYLLPREVVEGHERGEIHYHDLDYAPFFPMFNCMLIDLQGMLTRGFKMGNAEIEPPKSIATATAVTAQIIAQVASHIYGGTTINRIDEVLAPYVRASQEKHRAIARQWQIADVEGYADARTRKECYDAFQSLEYEVNTLHTANGQTPFVTFGFGLGTDEAARLIQQAILENRLAGLGRNHKTAVFPKLVFALREGVNLRPQDANYDIKQLALRCASQRMYPDILNFEQVVKVTGSFKTPMGCRSFLGRYEENGEEIHEGRNNLGVISLNLPRIALEAAGDESRFWSLLDERLTLARCALMTRVARLEGVKARVAPILYMEGACGVRLQADDDIAPLFRHGRASLSLGYIGLHETINALYGTECHLFDSPARREKALAIVQHLRTATEKWKAETGYGFSLYSTPSENLCDRFCRLDAARFGLVAGVTDKGYYTNSYHLDVEKKVNPYDKLDFEAPYPAIASGGFICYGEYPNLQHNLKALEDVWDYSYSRVPYYGTNTPIDECYACGYHGEFTCTSKGFVCPGCGNHDPASVSVTRRVCGYLGSPDARPFNAGKQEEVKRRVKHLPAGVAE
ncbi:anaerobic ribonucleoside-triphosphate reductase [Erwinia sp. OLTSP20]|uniref:anaerobic ribonucleoside-triphosphate reductase n=1 Tax=unclassified Erwinia TaxID=2622719 RepID=UPI000C17A32F|nr:MULTISPECIES: anaerobic ribonucleoside-triphosphate reductase [unclassified Erwinia]PIJ51009.1 anaerobic ribonucleoside-triphosphate reductase [Erwinia sp. OAMSP11]PIJ73723.1 anaerobic ribonucleoside-triphosphate reductase [Erwinia sp. OLSSP12]PIJ83080.1 anaerobic ribonucleoside-triphosphate reductase [Erwinia sp. OLCASP19]PIJ85678.1 anaerobic ribonucleoside-triphosphate reductase [Erwinia sp. OLMTSP26]PIJ87671.1 anaerobic ribonucleoside-triphosphate reductase [Erwinia sp. OLMDSP33]